VDAHPIPSSFSLDIGRIRRKFALIQYLVPKSLI
jgi:hypothetical protein